LVGGLVVVTSCLSAMGLRPLLASILVMTCTLIGWLVKTHAFGSNESLATLLGWGLIVVIVYSPVIVGAAFGGDGLRRWLQKRRAR